MNIRDRVNEVEQKFNAKEQERQQHVKAIEECVGQLNQLRGEWRVLKELEDSEEPDVIEPKIEEKN